MKNPEFLDSNDILNSNIGDRISSNVGICYQKIDTIKIVCVECLCLTSNEKCLTSCSHFSTNFKEISTSKATDFWTPIEITKPTEDGHYLVKITTKALETSTSMCMFVDGEFMSSFVTHWTKIYV